MIERLTDRSRQVLVFAREEASLLGHSSVGTEHILLGLILETEGIGGRVLRGLGIAVGPLRQQLRVAVKENDVTHTRASSPVDQIQRVITQALHEAFDLGHSFIGTEHILLALVAEIEHESVAVQVLVDLGVNQEQIRARTVQLMSGLTTVDAVSEDPSNSIKDAATNMTNRTVMVEIPDEDVTNDGPGLFDVNDSCEAIPATLGARALAQGPTHRRGDRGGETLDPRTAEELRRFSLQAEASVTQVRFLNADIADVEFSLSYRSQPAQSVVGRVERHDQRWFVSPDSIRQVLRMADIDPPSDPGIERDST